jgi:hypothetical protein
VTVSYITTAANAAAGPTTTVTVITGMSVQVGDLIYVMCKHAGAASSITVADANGVVTSYAEVTPYTSHAGGAIHARTFFGVAGSTSALNVTMTVGASRTALKCIVSQARSTKGITWTQGANAQNVFSGIANSFPDARVVCGRTSGIYFNFIANSGGVTFTPGDTLTEAYDSTEWVAYRILEQAGATMGFCSATAAMDWLSHLAFFSDDNEPTSGVRLMNVSRWQLFAGATSGSHSESFTAPDGTVLIAKCWGGIGGSQLITAITYNGVSFTELFQDDLSGAGVQVGAAVFMAVTGADGLAHTPAFTSNVNLDGVFLQLEAWAGVESSSVAAAHRTIYAAGDGGAGAGADLTVVDSQADDIVWSLCDTWISGAGVSPDFFPVTSETTHPQLSSNDLASQYQVASGANTVVTFTGDDYCTNVAFALVPAAGEEEPVSNSVPGSCIYVLP